MTEARPMTEEPRAGEPAMGRPIIDSPELLRAELGVRRGWSDAMDDAARGDTRKLRAMIEASVGRTVAFTQQDAEDCRDAYRDLVLMARHYQDLGPIHEPDRIDCRDRAARLYLLAKRIEAALTDA